MNPFMKFSNLSPGISLISHLFLSCFIFHCKSGFLPCRLMRRLISTTLLPTGLGGRIGGTIAGLLIVLR